MIKYKVRIDNDKTFFLISEDYFCDKKCMWDSHQSTLNKLYKSAVNFKKKIEILDVDSGNLIKFNELKFFRQWLVNNQPINLEVVSDVDRSTHDK